MLLHELMKEMLRSFGFGEEVEGWTLLLDLLLKAEEGAEGG